MTASNNPQGVATPDPTGWRVFIENVIEGSNYFRASEYLKLLAGFEATMKERDEARGALIAIKAFCQAGKVNGRGAISAIANQALGIKSEDAGEQVCE
jgi:hypothetical protein